MLVLAESTSLTFLAWARILAMALGCRRTSTSVWRGWVGGWVIE